MGGIRLWSGQISDVRGARVTRPVKLERGTWWSDTKGICRASVCVKEQVALKGWPVVLLVPVGW